MFHNRSIHYSIGEMLVNSRLPTKFLQGRDLFAALQKEAVHICTWPGTSEEAEKAKGREVIHAKQAILIVLLSLNVLVSDTQHDAATSMAGLAQFVGEARLT